MLLNSFNRAHSVSLKRPNKNEKTEPEKVQKTFNTGKRSYKTNLKSGTPQISSVFRLKYIFLVKSNIKSNPSTTAPRFTRILLANSDFVFSIVDNSGRLVYNMYLSLNVQKDSIYRLNLCI